MLAAFDSTDACGRGRVGVVAAGIQASAMEIMDRLTIEAAEAAVHPGYPDANALLLVELDGPAPQVEEDFAAVERDLPRLRGVGDPHRRGRPRARAPLEGPEGGVRGDGAGVARLLRPGWGRPADEAPGGAAADRRRSSDEYGLRVGNVFHAGDGNLHPLVLYDGAVEGQAAQAQRLAEAILEACIDAGGSLTGEHGIGVDKACSMPLLFDADDLAAMQRLRGGVRPGRAVQPREALPDAAAVRRGARAVPRCIRWRRPGLPSVSEIWSVHEAAEVLAGAAERGERVSIGRPGGEIEISTRRLDQVLEHEAGDLTAIVEAGIRVVDLNARLEASTGRCSRSTRRGTRRSARASRRTCPARGATATGRRATS